MQCIPKSVKTWAEVHKNFSNKIREVASGEEKKIFVLQLLGSFK